METKKSRGGGVCWEIDGARNEKRSGEIGRKCKTARIKTLQARFILSLPLATALLDDSFLVVVYGLPRPILWSDANTLAKVTGYGLLVARFP